MKKVKSFCKRNRALAALIGEALIFAAVLTGCYLQYLQSS